MTTKKTFAGQHVEFRGNELEVSPKCRLQKREGHWICCNHDSEFHEPLDLVLHLEESGTHIIAWSCNSHGLEVP